MPNVPDAERDHRPGPTTPRTVHTRQATDRTRPAEVKSELTTNMLRGESKDGQSPGDQGLAIGQTGLRIFDCPTCSRPLAIGTSRCPGCGARLVMRVTLRRAAGILALGVVLGTAVGVALTAAIVTLAP